MVENAEKTQDKKYFTGDNMAFERENYEPANLDVEDDPKVKKLIQGKAEFVGESLEAAEKWIDEQPIVRLRQIIEEDKWVMGPTGDEDELSEAELRSYMKSLLFESKSFVAIALAKNKIPFEIEEYEDE